MPGWTRGERLTSLDPFRTAMRFSLWTWALYWPGGGMLLLLGGLDLVSGLVTLGSLLMFIVLMAGGALKADSSRNMKQFMLERPLYLVAALVLLIALAPFFAPAEDMGLRLFSLVYIGGIVFAAVRLAQHLQAEDTGVMEARADQAFILFGLMFVGAGLVFLDAWLPLFGAASVGGSSATVAVANWLNLAYPPLLMLAVRPFREPLRWPRRGRAPVVGEGVVAPVDAS